MLCSYCHDVLPRRKVPLSSYDAFLSFALLYLHPLLIGHIPKASSSPFVYRSSLFIYFGLATMSLHNAGGHEFSTPLKGLSQKKDRELEIVSLETTR
jgi:hypothetical protein